MNRFYCAAIAAAILASGCFRPGGQRGDAVDTAPAGTPFEDFVIDNPVTHNNLAIFPIVSKTLKDADRFITLDEGLAAGTVKIIEIGAQVDEPDPEPTQTAANEQRAAAENPLDDMQSAPQNAAPSGDANRLLVLNTSQRPLYLMPGEVISGGLQDRTIGRELVIAPGNQPVPIDVYCVERGRWNSRDVESTTQLLASLAEAYPAANLVIPFPDADQPDAINLAAARGEFVASAGQLNNAGRLAVQQSQDQGKVWEKVDELHSALANEITTSAFASTWSNAEVVEQLPGFTAALQSVGDTERIVGVAVCIDGTMRSADVFESTPLFRKFWPKLLSSYALDAIAAAAEEPGDAPANKPCTSKQCLAFLKDSAAADAESGAAPADEAVTRRESPITITFSYHDRRADSGDAAAMPAATGGAQMGGLGGAVHSGVFAK